ncbi:MAG: hypothetical protein ABI910_23225, partial [Gemmatimonadota bacterium]
TAIGTTASLYERDSTPQYARVLSAAAKVPEAQVVTTLVDPRVPVDQVALFDDTSSVTGTVDRPPLPQSNVRASVTAWAPGRMSVALTGEDSSTSHLLIAENWYPDWRATVDGKPATVRRADHTLLSVDVPSGGRRVELVFDSRDYAKGKVVSLVSLLLALGMVGVPLWVGRRGTETVRGAAAS